MECPACGAALPGSLDRCPECGTALREVPDELVPLVRTTDVAFLPLVKSVLEAAGIPFVVQGEEGMALLPAEARGLEAIVHVPQERLEESRDLLASVTPPPEGLPESLS